MRFRPIYLFSPCLGGNFPKKRRRRRGKRRSIGRKRKYTATGGSTTRGQSKTVYYSPPEPPQARPRRSVHKKSISKVVKELSGDKQWRTRRVAIYVMWRDVFDCSPPENWKGKDGTINAILDALSMVKGSYGTVRKVLEDVWSCHLRGEEYKGDSRQVGCDPHNAPMIKSGSVEEQIVADAVEDNIGFTGA